MVSMVNIYGIYIYININIYNEKCGKESHSKPPIIQSHPTLVDIFCHATAPHAFATSPFRPLSAGTWKIPSSSAGNEVK